MIVVDSSVWIDFFNGVATAEVEQLRAIIGKQPLLVGDVMLLEILQGVASEHEARRVESALRQLDVAPMLDPGSRRPRSGERSAPAPAGRHRAQAHRSDHRHLLHRQGPHAPDERSGFLPMAEHLGLKLLQEH